MTSKQDGFVIQLCAMCGLSGRSLFCFKFDRGTHSGESGTGTDPSTRSSPAVAPPGKSAQPPALALPELLTLFQHNSNSLRPLRRMGCCAISTITITMHLQGFSWLVLSFASTSHHFACAICTKFLQLFGKYLFYEVLQHYHQKMA